MGWEGEWNHLVIKEIQRTEKRLGRKLTHDEVLETVHPLMRAYGIDGPFVAYGDK
jgi:hypothetical protein